MAVKTTTIGAGTLTIGALTDLTNFSGQVTSCRLVPSVDQGEAINVLSGETVPGDRTSTWTLEGTLLQDYGNTGSTTEWCFDNRGEAHVFTFVPNTAQGKGWTGTVVVEAIESGGDVKTKATSDFSFTLVGEPSKYTVV